jgi:hypothetical protein
MRGTPKAVLKRYIKRDVKMPRKQVSLSIGEPGEDSLAGTLIEKDSMSGFLSWIQRTLKILSLGAIWNFGKGTGLC